jgi:hypothetical protein
VLKLLESREWEPACPPFPHGRTAFFKRMATAGRARLGAATSAEQYRRPDHRTRSRRQDFPKRCHRNPLHCAVRHRPTHPNQFGPCRSFHPVLDRTGPIQGHSRGKREYVIGRPGGLRGEGHQCGRHRTMLVPGRLRRVRRIMRQNHLGSFRTHRDLDTMIVVQYRQCGGAQGHYPSQGNDVHPQEQSRRPSRPSGPSVSLLPHRIQRVRLDPRRGNSFLVRAARSLRPAN